jgi:hypothetical protein
MNQENIICDMIKMYEEYMDSKFEYKILSIDNIQKLANSIIDFFKKLNLSEITFNFYKPHIDFFRIDFYKDGWLKDAQYMCCSVAFTLTTGVVSGKHGVTIDMSINNYSYHYEKFMNMCLEFLNFLARVFNDEEVDKYDGYSENFDIEKIDNFIKKLNVEDYELWRDSSKYNL